jgi:predicted TIM-barrel fold metal-dependent hydrolase
LKRNHTITRRMLLTGTLPATACALARIPSRANSETTNASPNDTPPITDTHAYLSRWPHARLVGDEPANLVAQLKKSGVNQAWAGTFDGLFHKDLASANERLTHACAEFGDNLLLPFGSINPTLPAWEDDIRRCRETFHMRGIRLHPTYHGYTLTDPRFARLLELAVDVDLVIQIIAALDDKQHRWLSPPADSLNLETLPKAGAQFPKSRLLVSGAKATAILDLSTRRADHQQFYFDISPFNTSSDLQRLLESVSADRLTLGSGAPLHDLQAARNLLATSQISAHQRQSITRASADRLLAGDR